MDAAQRSSPPQKNKPDFAPEVCDFSSDDGDEDGGESSAPSTLVYLEQQELEEQGRESFGTDGEEDDDGRKAGAVLAVGVGAQPIVAGLVACVVGAPAATAAAVALITPVLLVAGAALLLPKALGGEQQQHSSQGEP